MNQKGFSNTLVVILTLVIIVGIGEYFIFANKVKVSKEQTPPTNNSTEPSTSITPDNTSSQNSQSSENKTWLKYENVKYNFVVSYPIYFKPASSQTTNLFEANSKTEKFRIEVIDKSLEGREFLASDGVVGNSIFKYSLTKDGWQYIGMYGGANDFTMDEYKVYNVRPDDESTLRGEGYVPAKYKTKNGLVIWVGKSTNIHSTQGGDDWQVAFIENSQKQFVVKVYMIQCRGYYNSCATNDSSYLESTGNPQTIFSVIDTLHF